MPFLKVQFLPAAFTRENLDGQAALNKATAIGVSIFQDALATFYTPGHSSGFDQPLEWRGPYSGAQAAARHALAELDAAEGLELVMALDLREGDAVDLQGMPHFTAETFPGAEFELATLDSFQHETTACTRLDFSEASVGVEPSLKFWTRRAIKAGGAHVRHLHDGRTGYVQRFEVHREIDGSADYTRAVVWFATAAEPTSIRVDELANVGEPADEFANVKTGVIADKAKAALAVVVAGAVQAPKTRALTEPELGAILAGLRLLQRTPSLPFSLEDVATNGGEFQALDAVQIDDLCEALNSGEICEIADESDDDARPAYYDCGICGSLHPAEWDGDCREDAARFASDELDAKHGPHGWREVEMPGTEGAE